MQDSKLNVFFDAHGRKKLFFFNFRLFLSLDIIYKINTFSRANKVLVTTASVTKKECRAQ